MTYKEAYETLHKYLTCDERILGCDGMCSSCPEKYDRFKLKEALKVADSALENIDRITAERDAAIDELKHWCD